PDGPRHATERALGPAGAGAARRRCALHALQSALGRVRDPGRSRHDRHRLHRHLPAGGHPMSGDSMRITHPCPAGLRVDGAELRLLMDPWLSRTGAFQAAWYQFPANAHLDQAGLLDCDVVTVSHEHLDHMDAAVLARLAPTTTVLIPQYPSPNFRD